MIQTKKHFIKIPVDNYWDVCNVQVRYEYGGAWHTEPPPGRYTIVKIHWYKERDDDDDRTDNFGEYDIE